jgi:hypothetical protein
MSSESQYQYLERRLSELYEEVRPAPEGLAQGRERMLTEGARLRAGKASRPLSVTDTIERQQPRRRRKMNVLLAYKVLAVVMAIAIAVGAGGGGIAVAADSLPGDFLYPVKTFSEEVKLLLTWDPATEAELNMAFASERVREMTQLAARGDDVPEDVGARLTRHMEQAMVEIARARPEEVPALLTRVMERARVFQQTLEQAQVAAQEKYRTQLRQAAQVMERTREEAEAGLGDPLRFREQYQHRHEGAAGPHGEPSVTPTRAQEQEGQQQQYQHQYEGTPGPHGEPSAPSSESPTPTDTPSPDEPDSATREPERAREEEQHRHEGTPGPHQEGSPSFNRNPAPTSGPQQNGQSGNGN